MKPLVVRLLFAGCSIWGGHQLKDEQGGRAQGAGEWRVCSGLLLADSTTTHAHTNTPSMFMSFLVDAAIFITHTLFS